MNDLDKVRRLLEPHGFEDRGHYVNCKKHGYSHDDRSVSTCWHDTWNDALAHFLDDKARTGARMADCLAHGIDILDLLATIYEEGMDLDEWWAEEWRIANGLEDPRKKVA